MKRRQTRQRAAILRILRCAGSHPTADGIYGAARKVMPGISKGTVYRNLKILRDAGEISELSLSGALGRYEGRQDSHYHFRCLGCGRICDLGEPVDREAEERVARATGFRVTGHQLEFYGLCPACQGSE